MQAPDTAVSDEFQSFKSHLRSTWVRWGLFPLGVGLVLALMATAAAASPTRLSERTLELRFQVVLAVGAGLFLIAFSLDNHWTNYQKLARRIAHAAGLTTQAEVDDLRRRSPRKLGELLAAQSRLVADSILSSTLALAIIGGAIIVAGVLAAAAGLGFGSSALLLILAAEYQVFVLSRHSYYKEVLRHAMAGELIMEPKQPSKARPKS